MLAITWYEDMLLHLAPYVPVLFVFAFGACVGSLVNVLVYRLPLGISVVYPPSRCPSCNTRLTWRENIPVFGWLFLGGRCRFCKSKISAEYPIVEATVGVMFAAIYLLWFVLPDNATWLGVHWGAVKPLWTRSGIGQTWPILLVIYSLLACLTAMTLVDAKTYTIPLVLPWFATAVAVVAHPAWAAWYHHHFGGTLPGVSATKTGWVWSLATPRFRYEFPSHWWWIGGSIGATVGIGVSMLLVRLKVIHRSFEDYEAWEQAQVAEQAKHASGAGDGAGGSGVGTLGGVVAPASGAAHTPIATDPPVMVGDDDPTHLWTAYPHARREMILELAYLGPAGALGAAGGYLADKLATVSTQTFPDGSTFTQYTMPPLWLLVLAGVLMGYLIGAGIVWAFRIFGSLAFGREAMGMGDVHLMGAVGACLGWIDATFAFLLSAFVGLVWHLASSLMRGKMRHAMQYGPYLSIATLIVLLAKPLLSQLVTTLFQSSEPIYLP